jgi:hypothetical protein
MTVIAAWVSGRMIRTRPRSSTSTACAAASGAAMFEALGNPARAIPALTDALRRYDDTHARWQTTPTWTRALSDDRTVLRDLGIANDDLTTQQYTDPVGGEQGVAGAGGPLLS